MGRKLGHWLTMAAGLTCWAQVAVAQEAGSDPNWPSFRGTLARGIAEGYETQTAWDLEKDENVLWTLPVEGLAHSSPIVWGDRIFLTTAIKEVGDEAELKVGQYGSIAPVPDEGPHMFQVLCVDRNTGKVLWDETPFAGPPAFPRHPKSSYSASTPATDGEYVVSFFGTEGLFCHGVDGEFKWKKDLGDLDSAFFMVPTAQWGFASSPIIHDGRVIVQCDVIGESFLAAFEVESGEEVWRTKREDVPTWSTPTVHVGSERSQVLVNGFKHIGGYDLATGAELWKLVGGGDVPIPTPFVAHGLIFITNAHGRQAPIYAIDVDASGEVATGDEPSEQLAWHTTRRGTYIPTPIVYGEELFLCSGAGVLSCYDAKTGEEHFRERLGTGGSGFSASPVAADGKLYLTSEDGEVHVVRAGTEYEPLSVNALGELTMATPAISRGTIYWRTRGHLVAIGKR